MNLSASNFSWVPAIWQYLHLGFPFPNFSLRSLMRNAFFQLLLHCFWHEYPWIIILFDSGDDQKGTDDPLKKQQFYIIHSHLKWTYTSWCLSTRTPTKWKNLQTIMAPLMEFAVSSPAHYQSIWPTSLNSNRKYWLKLMHKQWHHSSIKQWRPFWRAGNLSWRSFTR